MPGAARLRSATATVAAALACAFAACGDDAGQRPEPAPADAPTTARSPAEPPRRAEPSARGVTPAELDALFVAWREACDAGRDTDAATMRRASDAIVAAGRPALDRVLALLAGDGEDYDFRDDELIRAFGADAVGPLVALLGSDSEWERMRAIALLGDMPGAWAFGEQGPAVCRALVARLGVDTVEAAGALMQSRPAGRTVARDIAALWAKANGNTRERLFHVLMALGPDAAEAEPILRDALAAAAQPAEPVSVDATYEAAKHAVEAVRVLALFRAGDASFIDTLRRLLAEAPPDARPGVLRMLGACGESAAHAAREIAACLHDPDGSVSSAAADALSAMPSVADAVMLDLIRAENPAQALTAFAKDPAFAGRLARALPGLAATEIPVAYQALAYSDAFDMKTLTPALLRHALPEARALALDPWYAGAEEPLPPGALELLLDPDPSVRAHVAYVLAGREDVPQDRVLDAAMALRTSTDASVRKEAVESLGVLSAASPKSLDAVVEALSDADSDIRSAAAHALSTFASDDRRITDAMVRALSDPDHYVRSSALRCLARGEAQIEGDRGALLADVVAQFLEDGSGSQEITLKAILRFEGGHSALVDGLGRALTADPDERFWDVRHALDAVAAAGPRVAALRPVLVRMHESSDLRLNDDVAKAIAAIDAPPPGAAPDPDAIARNESDCDEKVTRLLALGDPGRRAIVTLASLESTDQGTLLDRLASVPLKDVIREAAHATGDDHGLRRRGAAVLAPLLPATEAVALLTGLAAEDEDPSDVVVWSLCRIERTSPGSVPGTLAVRLLRDAEGKRDWTGLALAELLGTRATEADPTLLADLRSMRDRVPLWPRCIAATALWRLTRVQDEALPTIRWVLAHPERIGIMEEDQIPWKRVGATLGEMRLGDDDVAAIVATLRAASSYRPIDRHEDAGQSADSVVGAIDPLCAVIEKLGPRGARAVPALRVTLGHWRGEPGKTIVRALGAIGPAARDALPDLRAWIALTGDPHGVARDAIRKIESAPR